MPQIVELANWCGGVLRRKTGEDYRVPDEKERQAIVLACLVVPDHRYEPPTASDRWGVRDDLYEGDIVLRIPGNLDADENEIVQYRAPALALADSWWRMANIAESSGVESSMTLLSRIARYMEKGATSEPQETLETLTFAIDTANRMLTAYRAELSGMAISPAILLNPGQRLTIDRCEPCIPGPGSTTKEPLEVELYVCEKTPCGRREIG